MRVMGQNWPLCDQFPLATAMQWDCLSPVLSTTCWYDLGLAGLLRLQPPEHLSAFVVTKSSAPWEVFQGTFCLLVTWRTVSRISKRLSSEYRETRSVILVPDIIHSILQTGQQRLHMPKAAHEPCRNGSQQLTTKLCIWRNLPYCDSFIKKQDGCYFLSLSSLATSLLCSIIRPGILGFFVDMWWRHSSTGQAAKQERSCLPDLKS